MLKNNTALASVGSKTHVKMLLTVLLQIHELFHIQPSAVVVVVVQLLTKKN